VKNPRIARCRRPGWARQIQGRAGFLPEADAASASVHVTTQGERPDQLASRYLGDPQRYWEICDSNTGKHPWQLASVAGEIVLIPEGGVRQAGGGAFYPI